MLCSDGLTEKITEEHLLACTLASQEVQQCAEALGQLALARGSRDNVSCIVVEVVGKRPTGPNLPGNRPDEGAR